MKNLEMIRTAANMATLVWSHRDDPALQSLFDNLWIYHRRVRSHLTLGGLLRSLVAPEQIEPGDRWANEVPRLYCSHLTSHRMWPPDEVCELLEKSVHIFREEFSRIDPKDHQFDVRDKGFGLTDGRNWTVYPFYDGYGKQQVENARRCPKTAEILSRIPGVGRMGCMAYFSIMSPHTHVARHTGPTNTRMRYHLGIEVPERDIHFRVHDQLITWQEDKCLKFDDSYEHEVFQQSDRRRVVFLLDLPHPELRPEEFEFLEKVVRTHLDRHLLEDVYANVPAR